MHHEVNHRVTRLFFQGISDLPRGFAESDLSLALLSVELIKITDVACWSEHHQLLMVLITLTQLSSDLNRHVRLSVFDCNCGRLRSR